MDADTNWKLYGRALDILERRSTRHAVPILRKLARRRFAPAVAVLSDYVPEAEAIRLLRKEARRGDATSAYNLESRTGIGATCRPIERGWLMPRSSIPMQRWSCVVSERGFAKRHCAAFTGSRRTEPEPRARRKPAVAPTVPASAPGS